MNAIELWEKYSDAIVIIYAIYTKKDGTSVPATSSGFYIDRKGTIVCCAHSVISYDPNLKYLNNAGFALPTQLIFTTSQYNGKSVIQMFKAEIIGLSLFGDVAVLKPQFKCDQILQSSQRQSRDPFTCQKYLEWGEYCSFKPGEDIYIIGDSLNIGSQAISEGIIKDPDSLLTEIPYKCIMTTVPVLAGNSGSPFIGSDGKIYGLVQFKYQSDVFSGGMQTQILQHVVEVLLCKYKRSECDIVYYENAYSGFFTTAYTALLRQKTNPDPSLKGEIVVAGKDSKVPTGTVLLKADGTPVSATKTSPTGEWQRATDAVLFSDILWLKKKPCDNLEITYKNLETDWKRQTEKIKLTKLPDYLDRPYSLVKAGSQIVPLEDLIFNNIVIDPRPINPYPSFTPFPPFTNI